MRPQVPFARGGAEIFTDALVEELRARGHEADLVSVPVQVVSGRARAHAGVPLAACSTSTRRTASRIDRRRRDEVPVVRRPASGQARLARPPVPAGVRARPHRRSGSSATRPRTAPFAARCRRSTGVALGEATQARSRPRENVAGRLERSTGLDAEVLPHPPQALDYRCDEYGDFVLSVEPASTGRSGSTCCSRPRRATRARRRRSPATARPRAARAARARARPRTGARRFAGRVSARASSPISTRAASPSTTRPSTRTTGWCRYEAFLSEKPVVTTTDAGGPLEVVARPAAPASSSRPDAAEIARGARAGCASIRTRRRSYGRAGKAIASEVTWDRAIGRLLA